MLPQPNFGPSSPVPDSGDDEDEGPPKKLGRLRIALWVQTVFAVLAGNLLVVNLMAFRQASRDELVEARTDLYLDGGATQADAESLARGDADYFHGTTYLSTTIAIAALLILAAILSALCAIRLKTRLKVVRRLAIAASIVLLLLGMLSTLQSGGLFLLLMLWVFASILAVWWLFSGDVKHWMTESTPSAAAES